MFPFLKKINKNTGIIFFSFFMYLVSGCMRRGRKNFIFAENLQQSTQYKFDQKSTFVQIKRI